ncbi:hypothetical protein C6P41_002868 [Kluyveromyces marxianus]|nr:hypothetical protein C6P43_002285 [Kluyveromyces marxianus]KAG0683795.1 hypothetical protein C6P41_002868 [Kluyveromyces marxianus]
MRVLLLLFLYVFGVIADVSIVSPEGGETITASGGKVTFNVKWEDDDANPPLSEVISYKFLLCTGTDDDIVGIKELGPVKASDISGNSYNAVFSDDVAPSDGTYFIQVFANFPDDGFTIHYSGRVKLKGVDGTLTTKVPTVTDTAGPPPQINVAAASINSASFSIPYTKQTGISRFAPMQLQPGSTVTMRTWSRKYPTSSISYYATLLNSLEQKTTITPGWSYIINSDFNYATPAAFPSDNGGWYDPKKRQTMSVKKLNVKRALATRASPTATATAA